MTDEYTPDIAARLVRLVLFGEWRAQMGAAHLTEAGLLHIRTRLDSTNEFANDAERELLLKELDAAIAAQREAGRLHGPDGIQPQIQDDLSDSDV